MFNTLQIKNLRGIKSAEINGFKQINLIFGKNNCGKSTVLEALFLVTGQSNPVLPITVNSMRNYGKFSEDDLNIEFYNLNPENRICISAQGSENRWLEISIIRSNSRTIDLDSLHLARNQFIQNSVEEGINLIIFDADTEVNGGGYKKRKEELLAELKVLKIDAEIFLWPDNGNDGDFETMLESIARKDIHDRFFGVIKIMNYVLATSIYVQTGKENCTHI